MICKMLTKNWIQIQTILTFKIAMVHQLHDVFFYVDFFICLNYRWRNGLRPRLGCGNSRVRARSGQTKDYKIGICSFSAKHAALMRNSKDWLAQNQKNVSEWSDMSTHGLLVT